MGYSPATAAVEALRYKAFISYSHTQVGLARALQDALYRFGTAWHERGGPLIFRDESGLAASPDLWRILRAALDESEHFIYLASPESAGAFYTQQEVGHWLAQRGPDRIILALASGNIRWSEPVAAFDPELTDALPASLHTAFRQAPLYVDLRAVQPAGYRLTDPLFRDKVASIASALYGKTKDELYGMQVSALIRAEAALMARDSQAALAERMADRALLLAAHALWMTEAQGEPRLPDAEAALRQALCRAGGRSLGPVDERASPAHSTSADGRFLCTVHPGDEARLWDLTAADRDPVEPAATWHVPTPTWLQLSADGSWLVAVRERSASDGAVEVQLFDARARPPRLVALPHDGAIVQADVSPLGEYLALSTVAPMRTLVWHLPPRRAGDGAPDGDAPMLVVRHAGAGVMRLAFAPAAATLCGVAGDEVVVWRLGTTEAETTSASVREAAPIADCRVTPSGDALLMLVDETPRVVRLDPGRGDPTRTVVDELGDGIVHRLEVSPDGRFGLLISESGPSYVVELERPTSGFAITSTGGTMNRHAFSQDGRWLATAAGPSPRFPELQVAEPEFDVRLRSLLAPGLLGEVVLPGHDDLITHVTFSPDGNRLVTCSVDRAIRIFDLSELNVLSQLLAVFLETDPAVLVRDLGPTVLDHPDKLRELADEYEAKLVQAAARLPATRPQVLLADDAAPLHCAFSGDSSWLVSAHFRSEDARSARLWDVRGESACAAPIRLSGAARIDNFELNQTCAVSGDARWLLVLGTCALWELRSEDGAPLERPSSSGAGQAEVERADFSPRGTALVLYAGGRLQLIDLTSGADVRALDTGQPSVRRAFFTEDDRWLIAACGTSTAGDPVDVHAWLLADGRGGPGSVLVSGSRTLGLCTASPRGRWLLAADDEGVRIFDLRADEPGEAERRLRGHRGAVADVSFGPDEATVISAGADGRLLRFDLSGAGEDAKPEELHAIGGPLASVTADWRALRLFAGGDAGRGTLLMLDQGLAVTERWDVPGLTGAVRGYLSVGGRWLSTWDGAAVRVFDVGRRAERAVLPCDPTTIDVRGGCTYTSDGRWLVVSRQGRLVLVGLDGDPDAPPIELRGHRHPEIAFRVTSDAHWLVSIDRSLTEPAGYAPVQTCRVWDLWSPDPASSAVTLPDLDLGVDRIEITSDLRWLITSSGDGVRAWPFGTEHLLGVAQRSIGREPDEDERRRYAFTTLESQLRR